MARKPPSDNNVRDLMSIQSPGAYLRVIKRRAERELFDLIAPMSGIGSDELAAHKQSYEAQVTAVVDQRLAAGEPVNCQSWELSCGLHAPFESFPIGGQRCFVVTSDDVVTLKPRKARSA